MLNAKIKSTPQVDHYFILNIMRFLMEIMNFF